MQKKGKMKFLVCFLLCVLLSVWSMQEIASARSFTVNSAFDVNDLDPGNGLCVAYLVIFPPFVIPFCTLRAAIEESNRLPGEDSIKLPAGRFSLEIEGAGEDNAATGDLDITESVTITGSGPEQTIIDARFLDRIFDIRDAGVTVTLQDVSLINGRIRSRPETVFSGGGAIRNRGNLILRNVVLLQHRVTGGGVYDQGGILQNSGQCLITHSTLQQGTAYEGGGLYNSRNGIMTIRASTFTTNDAVIGGAGSNNGTLRVVNSTFSGNGSFRTQYGGGVDNRRDLFFEHVTVAYNHAARGGGVANRGLFTLRNSIIAENSAADCHEFRAVFSAGHNLDSDGSCSLTHQSDLSAVASGLKKLGNYGGLTHTHGLYIFSPARDTGILVDEVVVDQRGVPRPWGGMADIGAFEFDGFPIVPMIYPLLAR